MNGITAGQMPFWGYRRRSARRLNGSHNPSAVGSSPTCPTGVSAAQRLAIRLLPLEIIPEQGRVAHLWHIRNLNPPVAGSEVCCSHRTVTQEGRISPEEEGSLCRTGLSI